MWIVSVDYEGSASHHTAAVNKASLVEYVQVDMDSETDEGTFALRWVPR